MGSQDSSVNAAAARTDHDRRAAGQARMAFTAAVGEWCTGPGALYEQLPGPSSTPSAEAIWPRARNCRLNGPRRPCSP